MIDILDHNETASETQVWPRLVNATTPNTWTLIYPNGKTFNVSKSKAMLHRDAALAEIESQIRAGYMKPIERAKRTWRDARSARFKTMVDTMKTYGIGVERTFDEKNREHLRLVVIPGHDFHVGMMQSAAA